MAEETIRLEPAELRDIPLLAQIAARASYPDRHTQLKSLAPDGYDHGQTMADLLHDWIASEPDTCQVLKAVAYQEGSYAATTVATVVGWICWGQRGLSVAELSSLVVPRRSGDEGPDLLLPRVLKEPAPAPPSSEDEDKDKDKDTTPLADDRRAELGELTSSDMQSWMSRLMPPGTKCLFVKSLVVAPEAQRRGVGRLLIRYGTRVADDIGVFCWIHASEAAPPLLLREGFAEVGQLAVDLDRFAHVPPPEGMGLTSEGGRRWGEYVFRYMRREAAAKTEAEVSGSHG